MSIQISTYPSGEIYPYIVNISHWTYVGVCRVSRGEFEVLVEDGELFGHLATLALLEHRDHLDHSYHAHRHTEQRERQRHTQGEINR